MRAEMFDDAEDIVRLALELTENSELIVNLMNNYKRSAIILREKRLSKKARRQISTTAPLGSI